MDKRGLEEILDECLDRVRLGEPVERVLWSHPDHAEALRPLLEGAVRLGDVRFPEPQPGARVAAERRMAQEVERGRAPRPGWLGSFSRWPLAFRAVAVSGAVLALGAAGIGASAAAGNAPQPVRSLFGISSSSIRVEFDGTIETIDGSILTVATGADVRTVVVDGHTEITRGGDAIGLADLAPGDAVEVKGTLQPDNTILATRVRLEDDDAQGEDDDAQGEDDNAQDGLTPAATPDATAGADDEDAHDDCVAENGGPDGESAGPGDACDDDADDDGEDEADDRTPDAVGTAEVDDDAHDDSGAGSGDELDDGEDERDDSSGTSGSGGTDDSEDHSSPGDGGDD
jgi:hypothetical protein